METNLNNHKLPVLGMILTAILVLGSLYAYVWWTRNRAEIYARRAEAAAAQGDWEEAMKMGSQVNDEDQTDMINAIAYQKAQSALESGDFSDAMDQFRQLGEYEDSPIKVLECTYRLADRAEQAGDLSVALQNYLAAAGYQDALTRADGCRYAMAEKSLENGDDQAAFQQFLDLGDFRDAAQRARAIAVALTEEPDEEKALLLAQGYTVADWEKQAQLRFMHDSLSNHRLAAGHGHAAVLSASGMVHAVGDNEQGQCNTDAWTDVIAVEAGYAHTLGLTKDGRVLAAGDNSYGQCNVSEWTDVILICCGPWDSYGLRKDGTLLHSGFQDLPTLSGWNNVIAISAGDVAVFAVRQNGSLLSNQPEQAKDWQGLCNVAAAGYAPAGLKVDGTLLCDSRDVSAWTDIVAIDSSATVLVGLKVDGTLLIEPLMPIDKAFLSALREEQDVIGIAVAGTYALILHSDGTLSAPGADSDISVICTLES